MTIDAALRQGTERLQGAGVTDAGWDAERLLRFVLGCDRATLFAEDQSPLPPHREERFLSLVEERARRRPLQHLTGTQAFWHTEFRVSPEVLIPRPETEILVEISLDTLKELERPVIVDVGTGSGCIALSLLAERPDAEVHAVDLSAPALAVAEENARRLGLRGRIVLHQGDLLEPVKRLEGRVDLVISNPPYIDPSEIPALEAEIREHEPLLALVPPGDRYTIYRRLIPESERILRPGGFLALEVGQGMDREVAGLCAAAGLGIRRVLPDLRSIPRAVVAQRLPQPPVSP